MEIMEKIVAVNITRSYKKNMNDDELYNCARGVWRASLDRLNKADYLFAVCEGIIVEVYKIDNWEKADHVKVLIKEGVYAQDYYDRVEDALDENPRLLINRYQFNGEVEIALRNKYVNTYLPSKFAFSQNPVRYINI